MFTGQKILVTGGCGFIGTHLVRRLMSANNEVRVLDLNAPAQGVPGVEYIQGNVLDSTLLTRSLQGVAFVYHLAAKPSVEFCETRPIESYQINFQATVSVLQGVLQQTRNNLRAVRVVFASSAAIYGNQGKMGRGLSEDDVDMGPVSHYGLQKLACEKVIGIFGSREPLLQSVILRLFNVFGPGYDPTSPYASVIPAFAKQISSSRPIQIHGTGKQTRDFIHIDDIVSAFVCAAIAPEKSARGQSYNIGTGTACSIRNLADTMAEISGKAPKIETTVPRTGDIAHSVASISRARKHLGWKPSIELSEGLARMADLLGFESLPKAA